MLKKSTMKQYGFIKFGGGINARKWINDAKAQGYAILIQDGYVELWK